MKQIKTSLLRYLGIFGFIMVSSLFVIESPTVAQPDSNDIAAAKKILDEWTEAYVASDYEQQWRLTDPRIRYWHRLPRWTKRMAASKRQTGGPVKHEITSASVVSATQLPCTEQKHCFRHGIDYILFMINSEYTRKQPPQPEFAVMARSEEGWRFGGGTFPFRPLGETAVIMTKEDELRFRRPR